MGCRLTLCSFDSFLAGLIFGVAIALAPITLGECVVLAIIIESVLFLGESVSCSYKPQFGASHR
jgi:hypothetical protein